MRIYTEDTTSLLDLQDFSPSLSCLFILLIEQHLLEKSSQLS